MHLCSPEVAADTHVKALVSSMERPRDTLKSTIDGASGYQDSSSLCHQQLCLMSNSALL